MKIQFESGEVQDVTTGVARRKVQAGDGVIVDESKAVEHGNDDKPKPKSRATRPAPNGGADAPAG